MAPTSVSLGQADLQPVDDPETVQPFATVTRENASHPLARLDSEKLGVSAIIPAYNHAQFLPSAINSVLNQTVPPLEVIVVDDGSTDNTREVVARYGDQIRYVYQTNAGLAAARNTGIRHSRFDYVSFLDADDEWLPRFLQWTTEAFARLSSDFAIVACKPFHMDCDGKVLPRKRLAPDEPREVRCRDLIFRNHFPCTVVARKQVLMECGLFDESLRGSEDRDMWIRVAAHWRVHLLAERLVRIRRHSGSMSSQAMRMKCNTGRVIKKAYRHRLVSPTHILFWLRVLSFFYFETAWTYYGENRTTAATGYMTLSLALWPWFAQPQQLNEPRLFRVRAWLRFIYQGMKHLGVCARPSPPEERLAGKGSCQPDSAGRG